MNEKTERSEGAKMDMQRIVSRVWKKKWLIITVAVLCAVVTFLGTYYFITPKYESSAMFYVNNNSLSLGDASFSISSSDITASKSLVDSYIVILQTRESLNAVIDYAGVDRTVSELSDMITAASVNSTEIFEVVVTSTDPAEAEKIADAISYILPKRISSIIEGTSAKVVDAPVVPVNPSSPSYIVNTIIGFLLGITVTVSVIVLHDLFDTTIRSEEDFGTAGKLPILAAVQDMASPSKGGYYGYGNKKKRPGQSRGKQTVLVGSDIDFAAAEAYKMLRTKLQFSFADDNRACRVIGVSSALTGEGKSLTSANLAYTMSELDKRVLLIDCDMRRPSLPAKLPINRSPGLSNYLSGMCGLQGLIQKCGVKGHEDAFDVIAAGRNPPNPVELLSSAKMSKLLEELRESYDYIILDLPPVGEVTDALVVTKLTDGMILVARQNYCNRNAFQSAVRQLEFADARILGIVYNCVAEDSSNKKYYKKYQEKYEGAYVAAKPQGQKNPAKAAPEEDESW